MTMTQRPLTPEERTDYWRWVRSQNTPWPLLVRDVTDKIVLDPKPARDDRADALAYAFAKASDAMTEPWKPMWTAWDEAPPRRWYDGLLWWLGLKRYA